VDRHRVRRRDRAACDRGARRTAMGDTAMGTRLVRLGGILAVGAGLGFAWRRTRSRALRGTIELFAGAAGVLSGGVATLPSSATSRRRRP